MYIRFNEMKDVVLVTHGDQEIEFITSSLYKPQQTHAIQDPFKFINNYINGELSIVAQQEMFELYLTAKEVLSSIMTLEQINAKLTMVCSGLTNLINQDIFINYMRIYSGLIVPPDIKNDWGQVDESFTRNKTYLRQDYVELLEMVTLVRLFIPIWGEYVGVSRDSSPDAYKEYNAYRLLVKSNITKYPALERLLRYVTEVFEDISKAKHVAVSTVSGIGVEEIPEWLCANLIVRRFTILPLEGSDNQPPINIITKISAYVESSIKNVNKRFAETIHAKSKSPKVGDGEQETSLIEANYRVKQELPYVVILDSIAFLNPLAVMVGDGSEQSQSYCKDAIVNAAISIDPTVIETEVRSVIEANVGLEKASYGEHNFKLTKLVLANSISTGLFDHMDKLTWTAGMILTQALLHHWGLHVLALSATAIDSLNQSDGARLITLVKPTEEQRKVMEEIFPYANPSRQRGVRTKSDNYGLQGIVELSKVFTAYRRRVNIPKHLDLKEPELNTRNSQMAIGGDITTHLINLIIKLDHLKKLELQYV